MSKLSKRCFFPLLFLAALLFFSGFALAHPGGLNAQGCHNNRKTGEYHCHRQSSGTQAAPSALSGSDSVTSSSNGDTSVVINTKSLKFHSPSCEWALKCTKNCRPGTLEEARDMGAVPCRVCGGGCRG